MHNSDFCRYIGCYVGEIKVTQWGVKGVLGALILKAAQVLNRRHDDVIISDKDRNLA